MTYRKRGVLFGCSPFILSDVSVDLQEGKVPAYRKSEPIPVENNEPVKVVVADSIQDMVFNSGKNGDCLTLYLLVPLIHVMVSVE